MKKGILWIIGLVVIGIIVYAALIGAGIIDTTKKIKVAVEETKKRTLVESVTASGKIYPVREVKISPDVSGEIIRLNILEGDTVRKGQLLATINSRTYRSVVNRAQAQLNQTKSNVQNAKAQRKQFEAQLDQATSTFFRNKNLFEKQIITIAEFEAAEATYKSALANYKASIATINGNQYGVASARANVNEAREQLQRTTIYAPMSGVVSALFVKKGERVVGTAQMAGTEMMRISDMSEMKVDVEVGENDIVKVKIGDSTDVEVEAYGNKKFVGIVSQISQSNPNTVGQMASMNDQVTNYTVSIRLVESSYQDLFEDNPGRSPFRPGMSASVEIFTKQKGDILSVPINAVTTRVDENDEGSYNEAMKEYVFIDSNGFAAMREVKTGMQDNRFVEIISGVEDKQKVIVAPYGAIARTLNVKDKIEVVEKKELYKEDE